VWVFRLVLVILHPVTGPLPYGRADFPAEYGLLIFRNSVDFSSAVLEDGVAGRACP